MYSTHLANNNKLGSLLGELKSGLTKMYGGYLKEIILFGSYARDDYDLESDIDIMILVDLDEEKQQKYRDVLAKKATDLSIKYEILVSVIDINYKHFNQRASYVPFYKKVMKEGIRVYAT